MPNINRIIDGATYSYNTKTGAVHSGVLHVANVLLCRFTGIGLLYAVTPTWPKIFVDQQSLLGSNPGFCNLTDEESAAWAIDTYASQF